ncbi:MAG TPA: glycosyltransferase [Patescibacteria group bacterium]
MINKRKKRTLKSKNISRVLLVSNILVALFYFSWWFLPGQADNKILFGLLFFGEFYHVFMALSFWRTIWPKERNEEFPNLGYFNPTIDIFITVAGEPVEIVRKTALAARDMDYDNHRVYILNDGYVAKKDNWQEIEDLAEELGINCITRKIPGGAKAGNVNNAVRNTNGELIALLDADMIPHKDFIKKLLPYFRDSKTGFVQSPQYYKNHNTSKITGAAWEQQEIFFGPIMQGKEKSNAAFICGTNFLIRRKALVEAGGMTEDNIAEDFLTSLKVHQMGWKSYYTREVLSEGLAPEDMMSYYKQQLRWARGSLEVLFGQNPIFKKNLSWAQKLEYLSSALYYFNGVIVLIDIIMPLLFLFFGYRPVAASSTSFAIFFLPFMFLSLLTLKSATVGRISFRAMAFSQSSFVLQLQAIKSVILKQKMKFEVTSKQALTGNYINLAFPHLFYMGLTVEGLVVAILREGINASVITNIAWAMVNSAMFIPFISTAYNAQYKKERAEGEIRNETAAAGI